ncbi:MAG: alpha/beta hydrolase, partial [Bacteroidota bacterium]
MCRISTLLTLASLFLYQWALGLNPSTTYLQYPDEIGLDHEAILVRTDDGAMLNAWYFPGQQNHNGEMVLFSHDGDGNMANYLTRVAALIEQGYAVVSFDYRGYGQSSGFDIDPTIYVYPEFETDLQTMIHHCELVYKQPLHLYGWGVGAGLALGVGFNHPAVHKIIADTPYLSFEDLKKRLKDDPIKNQSDFKSQPIYSVAGTPGSNLERVLLIVGEEDPIFSVKDMKNIRSKQKDLVEPVYVVKRATGKDNYRVGGNN